MVTLKDQNQATIYTGNSINGAGVNTFAMSLGTFTNPISLEITNSSSNQTFEIDNITLTQDGIEGVSYYTAQLVSAQDYYPFGTTLPGRTFQDDRFSGYRFSFNGKEEDKETQTQDYGMRIYDGRLGRFLSTDPLIKSYPYFTPYQFAGNDVIRSIDIEGAEKETKIFAWSFTEQKLQIQYTTTLDRVAASLAIQAMSLPDNGTLQIFINQKRGASAFYTYTDEQGNIQTKQLPSAVMATAYTNAPPIAEKIQRTIDAHVEAIKTVGNAIVELHLMTTPELLPGERSSPNAAIEYETVNRVMISAEAKAVEMTGLFRGGRDGIHYATDAVYSNAKRARQRLALGQTPEINATIAVPKGTFSAPSIVGEMFNMPGGGMERKATGKIPAIILKTKTLNGAK